MTFIYWLYNSVPTIQSELKITHFQNIIFIELKWTRSKRDGSQRLGHFGRDRQWVWKLKRFYSKEKANFRRDFSLWKISWTENGPRNPFIEPSWRYGKVLKGRFGSRNKNLGSSTFSWWSDPINSEGWNELSRNDGTCTNFRTPKSKICFGYWCRRWWCHTRSIETYIRWEDRISARLGFRQPDFLLTHLKSVGKSSSLWNWRNGHGSISEIFTRSFLWSRWSEINDPRWLWNGVYEKSWRRIWCHYHRQLRSYRPSFSPVWVVVF